MVSFGTVAAGVLVGVPLAYKISGWLDAGKHGRVWLVVVALVAGMIWTRV